ncbi:MAG: protein kinase [Planctomycetales bacterium]|nr:protein kinase [Planctomycetales bacterium]
MNAGNGLEHEDQLRCWLVNYDNALANGSSPGEAWDASDHAITPPDTTRQLANLLDRMETIWPRKSSSQHNEPQVGIDVERPAQIGRFLIDREIGRGGFGVVYLAMDPQLGRHVAIKMPRIDLLLTPSLRKRFVVESQATAALDHPHILPLYESGQIGSMCYMVTAYCPDGTLAAFLTANEQPLSIHQAAMLIRQLSDAVQYAHSRGILHRDIKPANVLLDFRQASNSFGESLPFVARLTDFGLARIQTDEPTEGDCESHATGTGAMIGTPRYMAPEQVEGQRDLICPATDVYGLGVLFYELLTGAPPFPGGSKVESLRRVLTEVPLPPRRLRRDVPADLEAICLHCLEKQPKHRYVSAEALSADLQRFLRGVPTRVRPLSPVRKAGRWARQRPTVTALSTTLMAVVLASIVGLIGYSIQLRTYTDALQASSIRDQQNIQATERQRQRAIAGELEARQYSIASDTVRAFRMWGEGQPQRMREVLARLRPKHGQTDVRGFAWWYLWELSGNVVDFPGSAVDKYGTRFSPDGQSFVAWSTLSTENTISIWHLPTRERVLSIELKGKPVTATFARDGSRLLTVDDRRTVCTWNLRTGEKLDESHISDLPIYPGVFDGLAFSHDGTQLAYVSSHEIGTKVVSEKLRVWNSESRQIRTVVEVLPGLVNAIAMSPDTKSIAISVSEYEDTPTAIVLIDAGTGATIRTLSHAAAEFHDLEFSPDGRQLAGGSYLLVGIAVVWDLATGDSRYFDQEGTQPVVHVAFSSDAHLLATSRYQQRPDQPAEGLQVFDLRTKQVVAEPTTSGQRIGSLSFSPTGDYLAFTSDSNFLRMWRVNQNADVESVVAHAAEAWCSSFSPDGKLVVTAGDDHQVKIWDTLSKEMKADFSGHESLVTQALFTPHGDKLVTAGFDGVIKVWDVQSAQLLHTLSEHEGPVRSTAIRSTDGVLASAGDDRTVRLWNLNSGELLDTFRGHENKVRSVVFLPADGRLVSADNSGFLHIWSVDGQLERRWQAAEEIQSLAVSADGSVLAAGSKQGDILVYELPGFRRSRHLSGKPYSARALAISPDARTLASGGEDAAVTLWHLGTGQELFPLPGVTYQVNSLAFSRNGQALTAALHDGSMKIWRAPRTEHNRSLTK